LLFYIYIVFFLFFIGCKSEKDKKILKIATTSSLENSGFFRYILPKFETKFCVKVHLIVKGSKQAIEVGKRGDVDLVFVHVINPEEGDYRNYFEIEKCFYNYFLIIGPNNDPAEIRKVDNAYSAFRQIIENNHLFLSRADNSGTYYKELSIWNKLGINPKNYKNYVEAGFNMEKIVFMADQLEAYTIVDIATWKYLKNKVKLRPLYENPNDTTMLNQYYILVVKKFINVNVNYDYAIKFREWLLKGDGKNLVLNYKINSDSMIFKFK